MQNRPWQSDKDHLSRVKTSVLTSLTKPLVLISIIVILCFCSQAGAAQGQQKPDLSTPTVRSAYVEQLAKQGRDAKDLAWAIATEQRWSPKGQVGDTLFELMAIKDGRVYMYTTTNVNAAISIAVDKIRNMAPYGVNGAGLTVGIWDGGAVRPTHQEFGGRVNVMDGGSNSNHATHVGGTVGAAGVDAAALGMAPSIAIDSYEWTIDTSEMASRAMTYPAEPGTIQVSNHSYSYISGWYNNVSPPRWYGTWGLGYRESENFGIYDSYTVSWDTICYNAPYYLPFKSAGNDRNDNAPSTGDTFQYYYGGWQTKTYDPSTDPYDDGWDNGGFDTIGIVGNAKNIMTIGAVADAVSGGVRNVASGTMSSFSGWGPTDDGRIKPDIVANGINLYSPIATSDTSYSGSYSGTSMSSPGAAGAAMLLVDYYGTLFPGQAMRASTLKALIIHTADDSGNSGPDYSFGWGLMNTEAAAALIKQQDDYPAADVIVEGLLDGGNPDDSYSFDSNGIEPIRVTLCWTDPPGTASSSLDDSTIKLINDLDLRVIDPNGSTFYPYILNPAVPSAPATTGDNIRDNVEQVYIAVPSAGTYTVEVSYKGTLTNGTQAYSLIITGYEYILTPQPPIAEDVNVSTRINTPITIELIGNDEGLPDPPAALDYIVSSLPTNGSLSDPNAAAIGSVPYTLTGGGYELLYTPDSNYVGIDSFLYKVNDGGTDPNGGDSNLATVTIEVIDAIYTANMDTDPGWTLDTGVGSSKWEWGAPTGGGGVSHGNPDPTSGYTGSNVMGYNLSGDYRDSIISTEWAKTPAVDCSNYTNVQLKFYRWLNVERPAYDHAYIEVSNDNSSWNPVWDNTQEITDSSWTLQTFDISSTADEQSTVYIRWGMGATDSSWRYSGWNIDDVEVIGDAIVPVQYTLTLSSTTGGSVTSPGEGSFQYNDGTVVDLNAVPDGGYYFVNWTGDTSTVADSNAALTTILVDANYTITANFAFSPTPPVITSTPVTTAVVDQLYTYDVNATGTPAPTFLLITSPNDMTIDANTGLIQWTPLAPVDVNVTVQAENIVGSNTQNFTITVSGIAPTIISQLITTATADSIYYYDVDANGIPSPTYSLIVAPNDMTIDANTGLIQWTPDYFDIGLEIPVTVEATSNQGSNQQIFTIDILCGDNFNDNTRSAMWRSFRDSYELTTITEDQNQLEILAPEPNNNTAAFFGNNNWTLDPNQDFALQIDFHYDLNSTPQGWVGISIENQQNYFAISAGADGNDSYYYFETVEDGNIVSEQQARDTNEGSLYIWYDVDSNSMYLSHIGFNVEDAYQWQSVANPLQQDWTSPLNIFAGGGTQGDPLTGDVAHLDNFKLVQGSILDWPPVTDLDGNGFIGLGDIAIIGENWLTNPSGPPDFNADGTVNFTDFSELANAY